MSISRVKIQLDLGSSHVSSQQQRVRDFRPHNIGRITMGPRVVYYVSSNKIRDARGIRPVSLDRLVHGVNFLALIDGTLSIIQEGRGGRQDVVNTTEVVGYPASKTFEKSRIWPFASWLSDLLFQKPSKSHSTLRGIQFINFRICKTCHFISFLSLRTANPPVIYPPRPFQREHANV